jgi:single-stranded-DNA-specific exonuclease
MVADAGVSRGVTGILAARIARHFRAPALVAACLEDRVVGSLRGRVRLKSFLDAFADLFTDYGGHDFAAGFNMPVPNLPEFERRFYEAARELEEGQEDSEVIRVDAEIPHRYLTPELFQVAERFEPYGEGNPPLVFLTKGLRIVQCEAVGKKGASHVRLLLASEQHKWPAIWWDAADRLGKELVADASLDVVYRLSRNEWRGRQRLQLTILDVKR